MKWSWKLGRVAGIGVYVHWTFLLLVAWIVYLFLSAGQGLAGVAVGLAFVAVLFGCIVLHELGHALTARQFGVETRDITLLPIGGMARLQRIPEHPTQELLVALAGPAVNVVIAAVLFAVLAPAVGLAQLWPGELLSGKFLQNLMWVNVALVVFNMLPAFPMDGGRVLRALLARQMDYTRATDIAASVGQMLAICFAFLALLSFSPILFIVSLFVYFGAEGEARLVRIRMMLRDVPVHDAMITHFKTLKTDDSLQTAADELLCGSQRDFPVTDNGHLEGVLEHQKLLAGLREGGDHHVKEYMSTNCLSVDDRDMLMRVMDELGAGKCSTVPVLHNDHLVGLVTLENIGELMMVRTALHDRERP